MGIAFDHQLASQPADATDPFDLVGARSVSASFPARVFELLGRPIWLKQGTRLQDLDDFPDTITVREYLVMFGNLHRLGPDPAYYIALANSGLPLFAGGLDTALKFAPDLQSALELLPRYAHDRPAFLAYDLVDDGAEVSLELRPMTALGDAHTSIMETWLLYFALLAVRHTGGKVPGTRIELAYGPLDHHARLKDAAACDVHCNAGRNAIVFARSAALRPNLAHDPSMWSAALQRCDDEVELRRRPDDQAELRALVVQAMQRTGKVPRLADMARQLGVSGRTLIRRLGEHGLRYQSVIDDVLKRRAVQLLADPAVGLDQVASDTGFSDTSAFHRSFRRWFGTTPAAYRAAFRAAAQTSRGLAYLAAVSLSWLMTDTEKGPDSVNRTWPQSCERTSEEEVVLRT